MTVCGMSAFTVAIGGKRTWVSAVHTSANDPKRTLLNFRSLIRNLACGRIATKFKFCGFCTVATGTGSALPLLF